MVIALLLFALAAPSMPASKPSPAMDAEKVAQRWLTWTAPPEATYFILTLAPKGKLDRPASEYHFRFFGFKEPRMGMPDLPHGWQFDWKVDSCNFDGCAFGSIWTFTTK